MRGKKERKRRRLLASFLFPASAFAPLFLCSHRLRRYASCEGTTLNAEPWLGVWRSHRSSRRGATEESEMESSSPTPPTAPPPPTIARAAGALQGSAFSFLPAGGKKTPILSHRSQKKRRALSEAIRIRVSKTTLPFFLFFNFDDYRDGLLVQFRERGRVPLSCFIQIRTCSGATREIEAVELRFMVAEFLSCG